MAQRVEDAVGFRGSGFAVLPLARLLARTRKTGDLHIWRDRSAGVLSFERGRLIAASTAETFGVAALESIGLALDGGDFAWSDGEPSLAPNLGDSDALSVLAAADRSVPRPAAKTAFAAQVLRRCLVVAVCLVANLIVLAPGGYLGAMLTEARTVVAPPEADHMSNSSGGMQSMPDMPGMSGMTQSPSPGR